MAAREIVHEDDGSRWYRVPSGKRIYLCSFSDCEKTAVKDGVCPNHCADYKRVIKTCSEEGCTAKARKAGKCFKHGGKVKCSEEGCEKFARDKGLCGEHGGKRQKCTVEGCTNVAQKRGLCVAHGAPKTKCSKPGCKNKAVLNGVCYGHGAPRKLCSTEGCTSKAQNKGLCYKHGADRTYCSVQGCPNLRVKDGICYAHGAEPVLCGFEDCVNIARKDGWCFMHSTQLYKDQEAERNKKYRYAHMNVRLARNLRSRVYKALMGLCKSEATLELLGCSDDDLMYHLESQFNDGMTWDNYGGKHGWQMDHIRPCVDFDLSDPYQQHECFHYTNLQPLWPLTTKSKVVEQNRNVLKP